MTRGPSENFPVGKEKLALEALGRRVTVLLLDANMHQRDVATRVGISQGNLSKLARGRHAPRLTTLLRLQWLFELNSIEELFGPSPTARLLAAEDETPIRKQAGG
jgi:transcriptional regulator with XRE-family HTH domain